MSIVGVLVVLGLVALAVCVLSKTTQPQSDPDGQPILGGQAPRAPGGHPVPGVGPDGRP